MNISPIKNIRYVVRKYIYPRRKTPGTDALFLQPGGLSKENSLIREPSSDLFQRSSYSDLLAEIEYKSLKNYNANRFLNIFHINKTNYAKLSPAELKMLRAQLSPELVERAEVLVAASKIIKIFLMKNSVKINIHLFLSGVLYLRLQTD